MRNHPPPLGPAPFHHFRKFYWLSFRRDGPFGERISQWESWEFPSSGNIQREVHEISRIFFTEVRTCSSSLMLLMCTGSEGTTSSSSSSTEILSVSSLSVIVAYVCDRVGPFLVSSLAPKRLLLFSLYACLCVCLRRGHSKREETGVRAARRRRRRRCLRALVSRARLLRATRRWATSRRSGW